MEHDYDDDYATCVETHATLRIFSCALSPDEISQVLNHTPTKSFLKGARRTNFSGAANPLYTTNGWLYETDGECDSRDCRRHLDLLVEKFIHNSAALAKLRESGCEMDVTVYYVYSQGGPTISAKQMAAFAESGLSIWWDLYRED